MKDALINADQNRQMFDAISARYDRLNSILSLGLDRYWRRKAVVMLNPQPGQHVLDIGCGTGKLSLEVLRQQSHIHIKGIDHSAQMIHLADHMVRQLGLGHKLEFAVGDALALDALDQSFDRVISGFCIRNLVDRTQGFMQMYRVLKPGGIMVALELSRPDKPFLRFSHRVYNSLFVPAAGRLLSKGDAYTYLKDSIEAFPSTDRLLSLMQTAGFDQVRATALTGGIVRLFIGKR